MSFIPLHVHSQYSILDGIIKVDKLCQRVKELGMPACAITDHGNMYGVIEFYKAAKTAGIKPIIGCEVYVTEDRDDQEEKQRDNYHMVLLATDNVGLRNLYKLVSQANLHNFYYKPRISITNFESLNEGLISTSACLGGVLSKKLQYEEQSCTDPDFSGRKRLEYIANIFQDRFYLELQDHDIWEQRVYNQWLLEQGKSLGLPFILTTDAHYLRKEDYETHQVIMAQQFKKTLVAYKEEKEMSYGDSFYVKSPEEMQAIADKWKCPEAITNTLLIAEQCNVEIELGKYKMPNFDITKAPDYLDFLKWRFGKCGIENCRAVSKKINEDFCPGCREVFNHLPEKNSRWH